MTKKRTFSFYLITLAIGIGGSLLLGEVLVTKFAPQVSLYPHYQASAEYGLIFFPDTKMRHTVPGLYDYTYTVNHYGYRGDPVPISNTYPSKNVVILGDSYSFGTGVNDGEEYSAVMRRKLAPDRDVVNLAVIGFGLTQEIRRFYEFGVLFDPEVVILQFCKNDPGDIVLHRVTTLEGPRFVFQNTQNPAPWLQSYLANSFIQKSQLFNFFRVRLASRVLQTLRGGPPQPEVQGGGGTASGSVQKPEGFTEDSTSIAAQEFYSELLKTFAADLKRRNIRFLMISVNGEIGLFPRILAAVSRLHDEGLVEYVDVVPWFEGLTDYGSPEGHAWGTRGHAIIGEHLAGMVKDPRVVSLPGN